MLPFIIKYCKISEKSDMALFIIWDEDNCVRVFLSAESAIRAIEALDVEVIKAAFDENARPYRVEWIRPNEYGKQFGLISCESNGEYRFVVAGDQDLPGLMKIIRDAQAIMSGENTPNSMIDEYISRLTNLYRS